MECPEFTGKYQLKNKATKKTHSKGSFFFCLYQSTFLKFKIYFSTIKKLKKATAAPPAISSGQWTPAKTLANPIAEAPAVRYQPNFLFTAKIEKASAKKNAAWPEGKEPLAE